MLDPSADLLPPSSPTNSSVSSSDLDTESTGSFFHDRSTTLGTLMGVSFPTITFRVPSQHRESQMTTTGGSGGGGGGGGGGSRKGKKGGKKQIKRKAAPAMVATAERRRWRWWKLCRDDESRPASLGEFLEVERRYGDEAFFGGTAELQSVMQPQGNGRLLFADGRVLPPVPKEEASHSAAGTCRFPVSLTGICSGGAV